MISGILDRHAELVELVKEVRANDCGAWMKECGSVFKCSDGTVKRQELARLLDKLYKVLEFKKPKPPCVSSLRPNHMIMPVFDTMALST
jgi:hypothetical protein